MSEAATHPEGFIYEPRKLKVYSLKNRGDGLMSVDFVLRAVIVLILARIGFNALKIIRNGKRDESTDTEEQ